MQRKITEIRQYLSTQVREANWLPQNFIEAFIKEQEENNVESSAGLFTDSSLLTVSLELFEAGINTSGSILQYVLYNLANNPDYQERAFEEIESTGNLQQKSYNKENLHLVRALIDETMRISSFTPLSVPRQCIKDTILRSGYHVPKGVFVFQNTYAIHMNPKYLSLIHI